MEDIAEANLLAMESKTQNLLVNIGSGIPITILELANIIIKFSKLDLKPIFENSLDGDIQKSQADITLAYENFNWKPKKMIIKWLEEIIEK